MRRSSILAALVNTDVVRVAVVVILIGTWDLLRDAVNLALDAVPEGVNLHGVGQYLAGLPKVVDVHDLHIWGISTTETALTRMVKIFELNSARVGKTRRDIFYELGRLIRSNCPCNVGVVWCW